SGAAKTASAPSCLASCACATALAVPNARTPTSTFSRPRAWSTMTSMTRLRSASVSLCPSPRKPSGATPWTPTATRWSMSRRWLASSKLPSSWNAVGMMGWTPLYLSCGVLITGPSSHVAVLLEHLGGGHALGREPARLLLHAHDLLDALQHLHDERGRHDDDAVLVSEHEVAGGDGDGPAHRAGQRYRLAVAGHAPAADRLHGTGVAGEDREAGARDGLHVAEPAVHDGAVAAAALHGGGDEVAEEAVAVRVVSAPHGHGPLRQRVDDLQLELVRPLLGARAALDRVGPAGDALPLEGAPLDAEVERRGARVQLVEHVAHGGRVQLQEPVADLPLLLDVHHPSPNRWSSASTASSS